MKAAIYCRVSTEEQRDRQTIDLQRDFARRYCELHEIPIADFYADDGVSGTVPLSQRPEGRRVLADAKEKSFDTVLVYRLDRLGRDPRLNLNAINDLNALGVEVKSMSEAFDSASPTGRFMVTMLSGMAGLERETIIQRMTEGTDRAVREGAWRGVVPFGYHREGERRHARLVVAEEPLPEIGLSEADVVRLIFRMSAEEGRSCAEIAVHLNHLGIPPAYQIPGHAGKRKRNTAGIWYPGRALRILRSTVYRGLHVYGRNTKKKRDLIERPVPAIVTPEVWDRAQETLRKNTVFSPRNAKRNFLLRGLMRCGLCGLSLRGSSCHTRSQHYYLCSGKQCSRGPFGRLGSKCPSRPVPGNLEEVIWADIEGFLRNPGPALEEAAAGLEETENEAQALAKEVEAAEAALATKEKERSNILALYRRGRIDDATVDQQLTEVESERAGLVAALNDAKDRLRGVESASASLTSAEVLLAELNACLDAPLTFELKRELVETLVEGIRIDIRPENGKREMIATVTYRFAPPEIGSSFATQINMDSPPQPARTVPGTPRRRRREPT